MCRTLPCDSLTLTSARTLGPELRNSVTVGQRRSAERSRRAAACQTDRAGSSWRTHVSRSIVGGRQLLIILHKDRRVDEGRLHAT